jgi:antitoxin component of MazEF toxin-antitoxin module
MSSVRLNRWGNSTGLRIPVSVLAAAGLAPGRVVSIRVLDNGDVRVRPMGKVVPAEPDGALAANTPAADREGSVW